jgi:hypothetical protein
LPDVLTNSFHEVVFEPENDFKTNIAKVIDLKVSIEQNVS